MGAVDSWCMGSIIGNRQVLRLAGPSQRVTARWARNGYPSSLPRYSNVAWDSDQYSWDANATSYGNIFPVLTSY